MRWKDIVAEPPAAYSLLWTQGRWRNSRVHWNLFHAMTKDLSWFFGRLVESTFSVFDIFFWSVGAHGIFLLPLTKMQSMTERLFPIRVAEETEGVAGQTVEERWWKQRRNQYRHIAPFKGLDWLGIHLKRISYHTVKCYLLVQSILINFEKNLAKKRYPTAHCLPQPISPPKKLFAKIWFNHKLTLNFTKRS